MAKRKQRLSGLEALEVENTLRVAQLRDQPLVKLLSGAAQIADQPPMMAGSALALVAGLLVKDVRLAEAGLRVLAATLATTALKSAVEGRITRTRPNAVLDGMPYQRRRARSKRPESKSFPSGHTADAVSAARALVRVYPQHAGGIWSAAALIALIQLPIGAHYPSDLLAGALVGLLGEEAVNITVTPVIEAFAGDRDA